MKMKLEEYKKAGLNKKKLFQIIGGKSGHYVAIDGKLIWVPIAR